jgi:hypothetical protein
MKDGSMRASLGLWMGLALAFTACGGGGKPISGDAGAGPGGGDDAGAADARSPAADSSMAADAPAGLDAMTGGGDAPADALQGGTGDAASDPVATDTPAGVDAVDAVLDATSDAVTDATMAGPGDARPDVAAACSPAPDQRGFYSSCSACPNPGDCDTIDVNGNRRYACGCSSPCPCNLHCGSYVIPGAGISIGSICVR